MCWIFVINLVVSIRYSKQMKKKGKIQFLESYLRRTSKTIDYCYFDPLVSLEDILRVSGGLSLARKTIQGNFSTLGSYSQN